MTVEELVSLLATDCEQPRDVIRDVLAAQAAHAGAALRVGGRVTLPGLVTLAASYRGRLGVPQVRVTCTATKELAAAVAVLGHGKAAVSPRKGGGNRRARGTR